MKFLTKVSAFFSASNKKDAPAKQQKHIRREDNTAKQRVAVTTLLLVSLGLSPQAFAENLSIVSYYGKTGGIAGDGTLNAVGNIVNGITICANANTNANNEPGCDMSDDAGYQKNDPNNPNDDTYTGDLIVRTNDQFEVIAGWSVTGGNEPVTITSVLPSNKLRWAILPSSCKAGSSISSNGLTLVCVRSNYTAASAYSEDTPFNVIVTGDTPNGTVFGDISFTIDSDNATAVSDNVGESITATAKPRWNLDHHSLYTYGSGYTHNGVVGQFQEYKYYLEVDEVSGETDTTSAIMGNESLGTDFTLEFDQILTSVSPNAELINCRKDRASSDNPLSYFSPTYPWRSVATPLATMVQTCTQTGGPGTPIHVKHEHIDASLNHIPTETYSYHYAIPATRAFAAIGTIRVFIPNSDVATGTNATDTSTPNELSTKSVLTGFDPDSISGQSNFGNLTESTKDNSYARTLYGNGGSYSIHYTESLTKWWQSTAGGGTGFRAGDGVITPGTNWTTRLNYYNTGGTLLTGGKTCAIYDSNTVDVTDVPGTPGHAVKMKYNTGGSDAEVGAVFEYATGYVGGSWPPAPNASHAARVKNECSDTNITWHSTTTAAKAVGPITKVRVRFTNGIPAGRNTYSIVNLTARSNNLAGNPIASGTIVPVYGSITDNDYFNAARYPATNGWYPSSYQPKSSYSDPHTGAPGDRILLVRAKIRVSKDISQTNASTGDTVGFTLKPTFTCDGTTTETAPVKVIEMLENGLNYTTGSSSAGDPIVGSCADLEAGVLKTSCTASHTILIWNLGTKTCNTVIPDITYSTQVDAGAPIGTLRTYTMVSTPVDTSALTIRTVNKNLSIAIPTALILTKSTLDAYYDINDQLKYTVNVRNGTSNALTNMQMIDILPFNGDGTAGYKLTVGLNTTTELRNPPSNFDGTHSFTSASLSGNCGGTPVYEFTKAVPSTIDISPVAASNVGGGATTWCTGTVSGPAAACGISAAQVTAVRVKGIDLGASALCRINVNVATSGQSINRKQQFSNTAGAYAQGVSLPTISNLVHIAGEQPVAVADSKANPNPSTPTNPTSQDLLANDSHPVAAVALLKTSVNFDPASVVNGTGFDTDSDGDIDKVVVAGQGTWTVDANAIATFTPIAGFVNNPTPIQYNFKSTNGFESVAPALVTVTYPLIGGISGSVKDPAGAAVVGAKVKLVNTDGSPALGMDGTAIAEVTVNPTTGTYSFANVPAGDYRIIETNPVSYVSSNENSDQTGDPANSSTTDDMIPVTITAGETDAGNDFVDTAVGVISGSVKDPANAAIVGAKVKLVNSDGTAALDVNGTAIAEVTVNATTGAYSFSNVPVGNYKLIETNPGTYVSSNENSDQTGDPANTSVTDDEIPLTLTAGETDAGNDFIDVLPASISGTVTEDINGDGNGTNPIEGVSLSLIDGSGNAVTGTDGNLIMPTLTAADGTYSFSNVPAGTGYKVIETDKAGYVSVSDSEGTNDNEVGSITVTSGADSANNNFVDAKPASISGTVTEDTNGDGAGTTPIEAVSLSLVNSAGNAVTGTDGNPIAATLTAADGTYSFSNVPAGTGYKVVETDKAGYVSVSDSEGTNDNEVGSITVTSGADSANNNFVDAKPASISGTVTEDTNGDGTGTTPIEAVSLSLVNSAGNAVTGTDGNPIAATLTAADGTYSFSNVPAGTGYKVVETDKAGYVSVSDSEGGNDNEVGSITVASGADSANNNFVDAKPASISGTVTEDTNGDGTGTTPIEAVSLSLVNSAGNAVTGTDGNPIAATLTAADGTYSFNNVPAGTGYKVVETDKAGYVSVSDSEGANDNEVGSITVTSGADSANNNFVDILPAASFTVEKATQSIPTKAGDTLIYGFKIINTGNVPLTAVTISDVKCATTPVLVAETGSIDNTLEVAETQGYTCTSVAVTQAEVDAQKVINTVSVVATPPSGSVLPPIEDTLETPIATTATYTMIKTVVESSINAPGTLTYNFTFKNTGNVTLTNLNVSDANIDTGTLTACPIATLEPNQEVSCSATRTITQAQIDAGANLINTATTTAMRLDGTTPVTEDDALNDNSTSTPVVLSSSYTMKKVATKASISAPGTINYSFIFVNTGNTTLKDLSVTDANIDANSLTGCPVATLAPAATQTCTAIRTITQAQIDAGVDLTNTATPTAEAPDDSDVPEDDTPLDNSTVTSVSTNPVYTMKKSSNKTSMNAPGVINYGFEFVNTGNVTLTNLTVADTNIDSGTLTGCPIATLAIGDTASCSAVRTITQAQIDLGTTLTNTAVPSATGPDGTTPVTEDDTPLDNSTSTGISTSPKYTMKKTSDTPTMSVPGTITYSFLFTNTGNVGLINLSIVDPDIDAGTLTGCPIATLAVQAQATCTATRTITQAQIDNPADIVNTAVPSAKGPDGTTDVPEDDTDNDNSTSTDTLQSPTAVDDEKHNVNVPSQTNPTTLLLMTANDSDPDGNIDAATVDLDPSTPEVETTLTNNDGTWTVDNLGNVVFTPNATLTGNPTPIPYTVKDNDGNLSNQAMLTVTYGKPPLAVNDTQANTGVPSPTNPTILSDMTGNDSDQDGMIDVSKVDLDPNTDGIQTSKTTADGEWTVTNTATSAEVTFTPNATFTGTTTSTPYTVLDNHGNVSNEATLTVTYGQGPTAIDDSKHNPKVPSVTNPTLLETIGKNDTDPDGTIDEATVDLDPATDGVQNSIITDDGEWTVDDAGTVTFTPKADFTGTTTSIPYVVNDNDGNTSNEAVLTVTYGLPPVAVDDSQHNAGIPTPTNPTTLATIATNDSDPDGTIDLATIDLDPATDGVQNSITTDDGEWTVDSAGNVIFTPNATLTGNPTSIPYTVLDDAGNISNQATLTVTYGVAPVATDDEKANPKVASLSNPTTLDNITTNDSDPDGTIDATTVDLDPATDGDQKTLTTNDGEWTVDNAGKVVFTPNASFNGTTTTIPYTVKDDAGNTTNAANLTVTYGQPPVTENDSKTGNTVGTAVTVKTLLNDYDTDADQGGTLNPASVKLTGEGAADDGKTLTVTGEGVWTVADNGEVTFTPEEGFTSDPAPVTYTVEDNDGNLSNESTITIDYDQIIDLRLTKVMSGNADEDGSGSITLNDTLTYTVSAENVGNDSINTVEVTDSKITPNSKSCAVLLPAEKCELIGTYTVTQADIDAGKIDNVGSATTPDVPEIPDVPVTTPIISTGKIALEKEGTLDKGTDGVVTVGDLINYTFKVTNTGTVTLTNVIVTDPKVTVSGRPIATLAVGAVDSTTFTASYAITQANIDAGEFVNIADVTAKDPADNEVKDKSDDPKDSSNVDPNGDNNPDDPTKTPLATTGKIALEKEGTVDKGDDGIANVGDLINYRFKVTNTAAVTLTNVIVTDPKVTVKGGPIATLLSGASDTTTFTASYVLTQADFDEGYVENIADVTSKDPAGNDITDKSDDPKDTTDHDSNGNGNPDDPTITVLPQAPALTLVKGQPSNADEDKSKNITLGDTLTYTITAINNGLVTLSNVVISDGLITPNSKTCESLAPAAVCELTGTYVITAEDVTAGERKNTATVNSDQTEEQSAKVTVPVVVIEVPPVALDDEKRAQEVSTAVTVKTISNDTDPDGEIDPKSVKIVGPEGNPVTSLTVTGEGIWSVHSETGDITFTPEKGFTGDPTPITYTVKDNSGLESNPATVTIDYKEAFATLKGTVWFDAVKDRVIDPNETKLPRWTVIVRDPAGKEIARVKTGTDGRYEFTKLPAGVEYTVDILNANGVLMKVEKTGVLNAGEVKTYQLPVDPSGVFYDSETREPVEGVTIEVINAQGVAVDPSCLLAASQQNQTTGDDGFYRFDRAPGSPHASCPAGALLGIRIKNTPVQYVNDFSTSIPPRTDVFDTDPNPANCTVDAIPGGSFCEIQAQGNAPQGNQSTDYFTQFVLISGDTDVINNHIPLDSVAQTRPELLDNAILLSKSVNKKQVSVGDQLYYTIRAENTEATPVSIDIRDDLPTGFKFIAKQVKLTRAGNDARFGTADDVVSTVPAVGYDPVRFGTITLQATEKVQIGYLVKVGTVVRQGNAVNTAQAFATGSTVDIASNVATAQVAIVTDTVLDDSTLIGKVFHDRDSDGYQDDAVVTGLTVRSGKWAKTLGSIKGRVSVLDNPSKHSVTIRVPDSGASQIKVSTKQGTVIYIDRDGNLSESHTGMKAKGLTAQDIRISSRRSNSGNATDITMTNFGINEEGIPGVRLATVKGLLIETDGYGRFHVPDIDGGKRGWGKNFILKVDAETLPDGSIFTTENPRVLRMTGSALNKINFGVKLPGQQVPQRYSETGAQYRMETKKHVTTRQVPVYQSVDVKLGSVFFDKDKHIIRMDQRGIMDDIATKIKRYKRGHITIDAFTDSRHNAQYNIKLAERRANTVRNELQKRLGNKLMRNVKVDVDARAYKEIPHNDPRAIDYKKSNSTLAH